MLTPSHPPPLAYIKILLHAASAYAQEHVIKYILAGPNINGINQRDPVISAHAARGQKLQSVINQSGRDLLSWRRASRTTNPNGIPGPTISSSFFHIPADRIFYPALRHKAHRREIRIRRINGIIDWYRDGRRRANRNTRDTRGALNDLNLWWRRATLATSPSSSCRRRCDVPRMTFAKYRRLDSSARRRLQFNPRRSVSAWGDQPHVESVALPSADIMSSYSHFVWT